MGDQYIVEKIWSSNQVMKCIIIKMINNTNGATWFPGEIAVVSLPGISELCDPSSLLKELL